MIMILNHPSLTCFILPQRFPTKISKLWSSGQLRSSGQYWSSSKKHHGHQYVITSIWQQFVRHNCE